MNILAIDPAIEEWREIPGHPEYEVSSIGRIKRVGAAHGARTGRLCSPHQNVQTGYFAVDLYKDNKRKKLAIHQIVALAFIGPPPDGCNMVRHKDGCRTNNLPSNLEWGTQTQNMADRRRHGRSNMGERNPISKLTQSQVRSIRDLRTRGLTQLEVATKLGVCRQTISDIERGRRWRDAI